MSQHVICAIFIARCLIAFGPGQTHVTSSLRSCSVASNPRGAISEITLLIPQNPHVLDTPALAQHLSTYIVRCTYSNGYAYCTSNSRVARPQWVDLCARDGFRHAAIAGKCVPHPKESPKSNETTPLLRCYVSCLGFKGVA